MKNIIKVRKHQVNLGADTETHFVNKNLFFKLVWNTKWITWDKNQRLSKKNFNHCLKNKGVWILRLSLGPPRWSFS